MRKLDPEYLIPLSPIEYQILLALAGRPLYGFALIEECQADSDQIISLSPGTAYPALKRLEAFGYIKCINEDYGHGSAHARRIFGLTPAGRLICEQETNRLAQAVKLARRRLKPQAHGA